jgi:MFS family permease
LDNSSINHKLFTKDFVLITFANFFLAFVFYILMTTMALYSIEQFNASQSEAGLASGMFIIASIFSRLFTGKYIEVIGRKKLLYSSLILFVISSTLYFFAASLPVLLIIRFIHGAVFGIANTTLSTSVMDIIPPQRRGEGTSYYTLSPVAATAIGPFVGLFITQHADYRFTFMLCTISSLLSFILTLFVKIPKADISEEQLLHIKNSFNILDLFEKEAFPLSTVMIFVGIAYSGIISFINSYAIETGLTEAVGYFFSVYAAFLFISRPLTGKLLDRKGDNVVVYPSILIFALCLLLLNIAKSGIVLLISGVLMALGFGTIMSCANAIVVRISPKHRVGLATSTFFVLLDIGTGFGPFFLGSIVPYTGYRGMYLALSILVFLLLFLYYSVHGRKVSARKNIFLAKPE